MTPPDRTPGRRGATASQVEVGTTARGPAVGTRAGATAAPGSLPGHAADSAVAVDTAGDVTVCPLLAWGPEAGILRARARSSGRRCGGRS